MNNNTHLIIRMKRMRYGSLLRLLWHPHQGFWNWELLNLIEKIFPNKLAKKINNIIIHIDTIILFFRAFFRRVLKLGLFKTLFFKKNIPNDISILYFDLGIHKKAKELSLMVNKILPNICENYEAYGFEASSEFFKLAQLKFINRKKVTLKNIALCYTLPKNNKIKLYKGLGTGLGSSIYKPEYINYEIAHAMRFSDWLIEKNLNLQDNITILRMNIEGAEYDVIRDLVEMDLIRKIDAYYGMWDDVLKINSNYGFKFRRLLSEHKIFPFTFNDRDFLFPLRLKCIEYDIITHIQASLWKFKKI